MAHTPAKVRQNVKESYETIASDWNRLRSVPWPVLLQFFEQLGGLELFSTNILLDLGCGNGRHCLKFAEAADHVVGVDFSFNLLKLAVKKSKLQEFNNVSYVMADITALPFREASFDSGILLATLHHVPKLNKRIITLREVRQVLKKQGCCLISVWRKWQKRFFGYSLRQFFKHLFKFSFAGFGDCYVPWKLQNGTVVQRFYHLFSKAELKKILERTGFKILILKSFGGPTGKDNIFTIARKGD